MSKHIKILSMPIALILLALLSSCSGLQSNKNAKKAEESDSEFKRQAKCWLDKASACVKEIEDPEEKASALYEIPATKAKAGLHSEALAHAGKVEHT